MKHASRERTPAAIPTLRRTPPGHGESREVRKPQCDAQITALVSARLRPASTTRSALPWCAARSPGDAATPRSVPAQPGIVARQQGVQHRQTVDGYSRSAHGRSASLSMTSLTRRGPSVCRLLPLGHVHSWSTQGTPIATCSASPPRPEILAPSTPVKRWVHLRQWRAAKLESTVEQGTTARRPGRPALDCQSSTQQRCFHAVAGLRTT
jgi:hypothetical protein